MAVSARGRKRNTRRCSSSPGFEANPYYFWSGKPFSKELVCWQWRRHMIVAGIEDEDAFRSLPTMGYHSSQYHPGKVDASEAPYLDFVDAVNRAGGLLVWAHPFQPECEHIWRNIYSNVKPYNDALLTAPNSLGTGVARPDDSITKPGGFWDQALAAYLRGERPVLPAGADRTGFPRRCLSPPRHAAPVGCAPT